MRSELRRGRAQPADACLGPLEIFRVRSVAGAIVESRTRPENPDNDDTKGQREIIESRHYEDTHGYGSRFEEIAEFFNPQLAATVHDTLRNSKERLLHKAAPITRAGRHDSSRPTSFRARLSLPLFGTVAAGAVEALESNENVVVPEGFVSSRGRN